jgi:hypothetical protein
MSNYHKHALIEFKAAKWLDENGNYCDEMQEAICKHILKLLDVFGEEGHSGSTAPYTISIFSKLAGFEPIVPITGEDWEWAEVSTGVYQNKRCSHVFKQADRFNGQAYDIDGKIFWEWYRSSEDGKIHKSHFTGSESCVPITFPYTPKREYVFVPTDEFPNESLLGPSYMWD